MEESRLPLHSAIAPVDGCERGGGGATFRLYSPYVAAIALRLLGRHDDVDDVVQDVFLASLKGLASLRDAGAIRGWLATVTVRTARRRLRMRRFRAMIGLDDLPDYEAVAATGATPEDRAFLSRVYEALDKLPADERIPWVLRHVNGDDLETIASVCDCSLATVKRRIAAAHAEVERLVSDA